MRLLFKLDSHNYSPDKKTISRPSARAIILSHGRVAMVRSEKYDYYKFPGGGIREGESAISALAREVREEAGLIVTPGSEVEYGCVLRRDRTEEGGLFLQENFYYFCHVESYRVPNRLEPEEADEGFSLCFVSPVTAIEINRLFFSPKIPQMIPEREARVLEMLACEGFLAT